MNVVFCVYRSWNLAILEGLVRQQPGHDWQISLVFCPEDMVVPAFNGVEVKHIDPRRLGDYAERIQVENPGVIICYGWSWIIPQNIIDIAPCLVLHPSALPKYRGGSPIQNQMLDGVTESAVSIIYAVDKLDAGNILVQEPISFEGYLDDIVGRMTDVGLRHTPALLDEIAAYGPPEGQPQDHDQATVVKRRKPHMSEITLEEIQTQSARYLYNKIRGLQPPYPEAFIVCGDKRKLYITAAFVEDEDPETDQ